MSIQDRARKQAYDMWVIVPASSAAVASVASVSVVGTYNSHVALMIAVLAAFLGLLGALFGTWYFGRPKGANR